MITIERRASRPGTRSERVGGTWAIVLAAGEGTRLRSLTADVSGHGVPKQFCALRSGPSLLHEALRRAQAVADPARVCTIVAQQHRRWWEPSLTAFPCANAIVQPQNRGTATGILLALSCVLERDPLANVVVLPSDHYFRDEPTLTAAVHRSLRSLRAREAEIVLLGVTPDEIDSELGYIVPARDADAAPVGVRRFVEKPAPPEAYDLVAEGALWNVFIVAAHGRSLLNLIRRKDAALVEEMEAAWRFDSHAASAYSAVAELYRRLPSLDFSRDVAEGRESALSVLQVPPCGWSDLGTPERVAKALLRPVGSRAERASMLRIAAAALSLEERLGRRQVASPRVPQAEGLCR